MSTPEAVRFGAALRDARVQTGKSVRAAAADAGISEGRWRQLERGYQSVGDGVQVAARPRDTTVVQVARAVGMNVNEALKLAGYPPSGVVELPRVDDPVGGDPDDAEEILFRLPPGLSSRQRETARLLARQSVQTYLDSLREE